MRISDWSSDVCSSDLVALRPAERPIVFTARWKLAIAAPLPCHARAWRGRQPAGVQGYPLTHANASLHKCALPLFRSIGYGAISIAQRKRSAEHTSDLQSLMRISYAVLCSKKNTPADDNITIQ